MKKNRYGISHIENSITNLLKPLHKKDKKNFLIIGNLIKNWEKVVGKKYAKLCYAKAISFDKYDKNSKRAKLTIGVYNSAVGFFLQNNSSIILDRISQLYGYQAIFKIIIKQEPKDVAEEDKDEPVLTKKQENELKKQVSNINNPELEQILTRLGKDIIAKKVEK